MINAGQRIKKGDEVAKIACLVWFFCFNLFPSFIECFYYVENAYIGSKNTFNLGLRINQKAKHENIVCPIFLNISLKLFAELSILIFADDGKLHEWNDE